MNDFGGQLFSVYPDFWWLSVDCSLKRPRWYVIQRDHCLLIVMNRDVTPYVLKRPSEEATPRRLSINYAAELNPQQHAAVTAGDGPALVIAGAGSGKTRTLVYRVAYLIDSGVDPASILLLTFTRKSAQEMLERVGALIGRRSERV